MKAFYLTIKLQSVYSIKTTRWLIFRAQNEHRAKGNCLIMELTYRKVMYNASDNTF